MKNLRPRVNVKPALLRRGAPRAGHRLLDFHAVNSVGLLDAESFASSGDRESIVASHEEMFSGSIFDGDQRRAQLKAVHCVQGVGGHKALGSVLDQSYSVDFAPFERQQVQASNGTLEFFRSNISRPFFAMKRRKDLCARERPNDNCRARSIQCPTRRASIFFDDERHEG